jgi:hypothetical protein
MKKLLILFYCAMLAGCASAPKPEAEEENDLIDGTGFCMHPMLGTFEWEGKVPKTIRFQKGTFIITMEDGRKLQLIGAVCRIKEKLPSDAAPESK